MPLPCYTAGMAKQANIAVNKPPELGPADVADLVRPPGRPRGSRNKVTKAIRDIAQRYTRRAVKQAWKLAQHAENQDVQLKALALLLAYAHGKPTDRQELTGKDGESLVPAMYSMPDKEIARRCALILTLADEAAAPEAAEDGSSGGGLPSRRSAGAEGPVLAGPTPPPSGASASSPNRSNGAGDPRGGRKDRADDVSDPNPTQSENFSKDAKPTEPQPGQAARCAGFIIRCTEASRPGLPNQYQILDGSGQLQSMAVNGWSDALRWIKARVGDDADMSIDIIQPTPAHEPVRPDQRQFATGGPDIAVLRGHATDRKL